MNPSTDLLSAASVTWTFAPSASILGAQGDVIGTSQCANELLVRDAAGWPVIHVGRRQWSLIRNDRYPVHDGAGAHLGWLGACEGVVFGPDRVARFSTRLFTSSARIVACNPPWQQFAVLEHLPTPGRRTALFSKTWRVQISDEVTDRPLRLMILAAAYVWHIGRGEE